MESRRNGDWTKRGEECLAERKKKRKHPWGLVGFILPRGEIVGPGRHIEAELKPNWTFGGGGGSEIGSAGDGGSAELQLRKWPLPEFLKCLTGPTCWSLAWSIENSGLWEWRLVQAGHRVTRSPGELNPGLSSYH